MTSLLIPEKALARLRPQIERAAPGLDFLSFLADGRVEAGGVALDLQEIRPDLAWVSLDVARSNQFDRALDLLVACPPLSWIQTFNTGLDDPRYAALLAKGALLCNSDAQAIAIAQYVFAYLLAEWNEVATARQAQREKSWQRLATREIFETTWLLVGFGHIGQEIARRASVFGARILATRSRPETHALADESGGPDRLGEFLPQADVVVLACPLTDRTRDMAGPDFFGAMKPGSVFVNVARGPIVDEAALLAALDRGAPGLAILDVFRDEPLPAGSPLWDHPGVRLTAHTSSLGTGTARRGDLLFLENLGNYVGGRPLRNQVSRID